MTPTPLLFVGDSPQQHTGLGRILRDLSTRVWRERATLGVDVAVAGWSQGRQQGSTAEGPTSFTFQTVENDWGAEAVSDIYRELWGDRGGIVWTLWDPARCFGHTNYHVPPPAVRWGYFAIDGNDPSEGIGGPAAAAVRGYDRVIAYGRYGAHTLKQTLGRPVKYLPHGLDLDVFRPRVAELPLGPFYNPEKHTLVGAVAANQPRKDLGLFCATLAELRHRGHDVFGWLHTDRPIWNAWSVPQLVDTFGLKRRLWVTTELTDDELAAFYTRCAVTIAPGLGEGFGYPIVESLACGTPVVHGTYGGGTELVPKPQWRFPAAAERLESVYAVIRPVYRVEDVVNAVETALRQRTGQTHHYCRGSVAHLDWAQLWPRWRAWVADGLARYPEGD
jgi:glycosyltransferase involved in cell wall biosynthesis